MENQSFAEASDELNKTLYNWAMGHVNQLNVERYFWPNKGNGYEALKALRADPGVVSYAKAEVATSIKVLSELKCHGTDLSWFFERFNTLIAKAKITNDQEIIRYMKGSFSTKSPYYDKLYRLLEDDTMTSADIVKGLHKYYVTHISQSVELGQGSKGKKGKEGETVSDNSSNTPSKGKGKRDRDSKDKAGNGKNAKVTREKQNHGGTPRITKSDYQKLSQDQKAELADTGKVKGFKIFECKDEPGMHRVLKTMKGRLRLKFDA
jgi:hypothetical protein